MKYNVRAAKQTDIPYITGIYNEGIEDRIATLETRLRTDGFREVGTYESQGILDGKWIDVTIMERLLSDQI